MQRTILIPLVAASVAGVLSSILAFFVFGGFVTSFYRGGWTFGSPAPIMAAEETLQTAVILADSESGESSAQAEGDVNKSDVIQSLQAEILNAALERAQLAESIAIMNRQIDELESDIVNQSSRLALLDDLNARTDGAQALSGPNQIAPTSARESRAQNRYDSLVAAGVDPQVAGSLQARQDEFQLQRLELIDLAEREGWSDSDQFSERMQALADQQIDLRSELGDLAYDRYLYEQGRSNRVIVSSVINGSEAQLAGLMIGDLILSYASERVFSTSDLQSATRSGQRGELVTIRYQRDGQILSVDVPRGPLGITLNASRREPS
ncbi:MAG: PDZ domain-containing protein [Granulosicoccus sp.]